MLGPPDGGASSELITFHRPPNARVPPQPVHALGIRHITLLVEDIEATVAKQRALGAEPLGAVQRYEDSYKLCYVRGPEGIILDLTEEITSAVRVAGTPCRPREGPGRSPLVVSRNRVWWPKRTARWPGRLFGHHGDNPSPTMP